MDRLILCLIMAWSVLGFWVPAQAQLRDDSTQTPRSMVRRDLSRLVVMLDSTFASATLCGAGVLIGVDDSAAYVATANHVVRQPSPGGDDVEVARVEARMMEASPVKTEVLPAFSPAQDIAFLKLTFSADDLKRVRAWRMDMLAAPNTRIDDPAHMLGRPQCRMWAESGTPERLKESTNDRRFTFETAILDNGNSGGPLVDSGQMLLGVIVSQSPPFGDALALTDPPPGPHFRELPYEESRASVADLATRFGIPFQLRRAIPTVLIRDRLICWTAGVDTELDCFGEAGWIDQASTETIVRPFEDERIRAAAVGAGHLCAITKEGETFCIGRGEHGELGVPGSARTYQFPVGVRSAPEFAAITAGAQHTCALDPNGIAYCWGANEHGQLGIGGDDPSDAPVRVARTKRFRSISAGGHHTCAISDQQELYCWGDAETLGVARAIIEEHDVTAPVGMQLTSPPRHLRPTPAELIGQGPHTQIDKVAQVVAGDDATCALDPVGDLFCWGDNRSGRLGVSVRRATAPVAVAPGTHFLQVALGSTHTCAIDSDHSAWCWGENLAGELGDGSSHSSPTPVKVTGGLHFERIWVGEHTTCAVDAAGGAFCWGLTATDQVKAGRVSPAPLFFDHPQVIEATR